MKKYAYIFTIGNSLQWSGETEQTLLKRGANEDDKQMISDFIDHGSVGSFIKLDTGEMIFRIQ
jgi:hypothetical protein